MYKIIFSAIAIVMFHGLVHAQRVQPIEITPLGALNTAGDEYSPRIIPDGLSYSQNKRKEDNQNRTELMFAHERGKYMVSGIPLSQEVNTELHESTGAFGPNSNFLVFSRNGVSEGRPTNLLYLSKSGIYDFQKPSKLPFNLDANNAHPTVDLSGKRIVFASDSPEGYGGFDLYYAEYNNGEWSKPINLGPKVNSKHNEIFPNWNEGDLLSFSSDRTGGRGGYDLYLMDFAKTTWEKATHLPAPFSSVRDDHGLVWSVTKGKGYFSSNRPGGRGGDDLYSFSFSPTQIPEWMNPVKDNHAKLVVMGPMGKRIGSIDQAGNKAGIFEAKRINNLGEMSTDLLALHLCGSATTGKNGNADTIRMNGIRIDVVRSDFFTPVSGVLLSNLENRYSREYLTDATGGTCLPLKKEGETWKTEIKGYKKKALNVTSKQPYIMLTLSPNTVPDSFWYTGSYQTSRRLTNNLERGVRQGVSTIHANKSYTVAAIDLVLISSQSSKVVKAEAQKLAEVILDELPSMSTAEVKHQGISLTEEDDHPDLEKYKFADEATVYYKILLRKASSAGDYGLNR